MGLYYKPQGFPSYRELLAIAESANPPGSYDGADSWLELPARDGWKVQFFYDCGGFDYIDQFTSPYGDIINFWDWPEEAPGRDELMAWCPPAL